MTDNVRQGLLMHFLRLFQARKECNNNSVCKCTSRCDSILSSPHSSVPRPRDVPGVSHFTLRNKQESSLNTRKSNCEIDVLNDTDAPLISLTIEEKAFIDVYQSHK